MTLYLARLTLGIVLSFAPQRVTARQPGLRRVPASMQTARELSMSHSDEWDCFRRGRDRFTTCERTMPAGSVLTVRLSRVVEVM